MSKETFKSFARAHPELATTVMENKSTWQKLYEIYEIYGEDNPIWDNFLKKNDKVETISSFKELFNIFKNIDLESVQKGVTNLQKTLGLLQELGIGNNKNNISQYEPRPIYKYFED